MPTKLVTIRIDTEIHQTARELGLNISKTCENCLKQAVQRLTASDYSTREGMQTVDMKSVVARGRFELPSAGPKPTMLVHYTRRSLTVTSAPPPGLTTFPFFRAVL